jgi:small subunit ribosomal protein S16
MAVVIRMRRAGTKKKAFYHVVAADKRSPRDGKYIEKLGYYDPMKDPPLFELDRTRLEHWLSHGAKTSDTVAQLIARFGSAKEEDKANADA